MMKLLQRLLMSSTILLLMGCSSKVPIYIHSELEPCVSTPKLELLQYHNENLMTPRNAEILLENVARIDLYLKVLYEENECNRDIIFSTQSAKE